MKKVTLVFSCFLVFCTFYPQRLLSQLVYSNEWQWLYPKPQGNSLYWCKMWDADVWYAAGTNGTFMKTTNGGANWHISHFAGRKGIMETSVFGSIYSGHFFNRDNGIISGGLGLMRTTNGGTTFDSIPGTFTQSNIWRRIYFLNDNTGYAIGDNSQFGRTTNGGSTWALSIITPIRYLNDFYTPNDTVMLACCLFQSGVNMLRSTNGGNNWAPVVTGAENVTLSKMQFINADTGFVCGGLGMVKMTTNCGLNWSNINIGLPPSDFRDIDIKNNNTIYLTGDYNHIYKSTNWGLSWDTIGFWGAGQNLGALYTSSDIGSGDSLLTVGVRGLINIRFGNERKLFTDNAKITGVIKDIWIENENGKIWAVGSPANNFSNDQIICSSNGGSNWYTQPTASPSAGLISIDMVNTTTGYTAGLLGAILKTTNGGTNWTSVGSPTSNNLNRIDFVDENTGWIFGEYGTVFRTTDGGGSWQQQNPGTTTSDIFNSHMLNANTGWLVGGKFFSTDSSVVRKTTDGGATWVKQLSGISNYRAIIFDIKMLNSNTGYFSGFQGVRKTTNGGTTWDSIALPFATVNSQYEAIDFYDTLNGMVTSFEDVVFRTTNGGESWLAHKVGTSIHNFPRLRMINPHTAFLYAGQYNNILKFTSSTIGVAEWTAGTPVEYGLLQNYPNPFNPSTTIKFTVPKRSKITLKVFDITGRTVEVLLDNMELNPGTVKYSFDGANFSSGVYFYSLYAEGKLISSKKMILIK